MKKLRDLFPGDEYGPLINELSNVLHFMGVDTMTKDSFCRDVVMKEGDKFFRRFRKIKNMTHESAEARYTALAEFIEESVPRGFKLLPAA